MMRGELPRNTGSDADGAAQSEADHLEKCPVCWQWFDMRDLAQVADHIHDDSELKFWKDRDRRRARVLCTENPPACRRAANQRL
jgi:hypothetical protein